MVVLFWDASALVKGYCAEVGSPIVRALLAARPSVTHAVTIVGYVEAAAVLRRRHNRGELSRIAFANARALLASEVIDSAHVRLLSTGDLEFIRGLDLVDRYSLNCADAAVLSSILAGAANLLPDETSLLIASDRRLLRAAQAEGLQVLNPEQVALDDLPALLASLSGS